ncbi:unnamed protein product [Ceutorhynchus assimilis]|uniref:G-protein coupled receptors family 1 profile domain-containing protein n=1 Tax=Ceutorhynchus assimilis TaxID=467358 RepID=A0A9N9QFL2_9CUCU|nr:unnamed protein product [Ceutorhynchus assimilis]
MSDDNLTLIEEMMNNLNTTNINVTISTTRPIPLPPQYRYPSGYTPAHIVVASIVATLLMIVVIVGNMLVIIAITTEKSLKNIQNWFIASLAVADFFLGLVIMPFSLANELMGYWTFGPWWCDVHSAMDVLLSTASIMNLCLISLDRYWSITQAVAYLKKRTPRRAAIWIGAVWAAAALVCIPPLLGWKVERREAEQYPQCQCKTSLTEVAHLSNRYDQLKIEIARKNNYISNLETDLEDLKSSLSEELTRLSNDNKLKDDHIKRLQRRTHDFDAEVIEAENNYELTIQSLKLANNRIEKELADQLKASYNLSVENKGHLVKIQTANAELFKLNVERDKLKDLNNKLLNEISSLTKENIKFAQSLSTNSEPVYERNRRFGHLVHALARAGYGAKLPSVGLCLNASKAVSFLVKGGNDNSWSSESRKAQNNVTLLGGRRSRRSSHEP